MRIHSSPSTSIGRLVRSVAAVALAMSGALAADQDFSSSPVVAPGAKLEKLAGGFAFTEGPASDAEGNVFFTDQPNDRIHKWSVDGKLSTFLEPCGRSNGLCFDAKGALIACADERNQLWSIDAAGKATVLIENLQGKLLNGPNDVWVRPDGGMYFSDPFYKRTYWKRGPMEQPLQGVYYFPASHGAPVRVIDDFKQPNGLIGTPDGKTLYVTDIGAGTTWSYTINPDATLSGKTRFCAMGSDGMTIDDQGNVYLTNQGVTVFDKTGAKIEHIDIAEKWTGNVCFGGKDHHLLFITASTGIYGLRMKTAGVGSQ
jgi:gluconolactonase